MRGAKRLAVSAVTVILVTCSVGCTSSGREAATSSSVSGSPSSTPPTNAAPAATSAEAVALRDQSTANGDYIVGIDITPGVWQCRDAGESVYWKTTDKTGSIIDNDLGSIARVLDSAFAVKLKGCNGEWKAVDAPTETSAATVSTSGESGSPDRDADVAKCHTAYSRFTNEARGALDDAVLAGRIPPTTLWLAAAAWGTQPPSSQGTKKIADAISRFNSAALLVSASGINMSDADTQEFMQSYYEMRTFCEDIVAWS